MGPRKTHPRFEEVIVVAKDKPGVTSGTHTRESLQKKYIKTRDAAFKPLDEAYYDARREFVRLRRALDSVEADYQTFLKDDSEGEEAKTQQAKARITALQKDIAKLKKDYKQKGRPDIETDFHQERMIDEAAYEDFMYYQNRVHRTNRRELFPKGDDEDWPEERIAEFWRKKETGVRLFKPSLKYPFLDVILAEHNARMVSVPKGVWVLSPQELHWLTPPTRHPIGGFGRKPLTGVPASVLVAPVDENDIEARRAEIENEQGAVTTGPEGSRFENHSQRRKADLQHEAADPFFDGRKSLGEFCYHVSGKERSDDWRTSYDCLGIVKPGFSKTVADAIREGKLDPTKKLDKRYENHFTGWAEETHGRREFHAHSRLPPSSPVDSPPHSPIISPFEEGGGPADTSPAGGSNVGTSTGSVDNSAFVPADLRPTGENSLEWVDYREKFGDHFGLNNPEWPRFQNKPKGQGFTVPYEPESDPPILSLQNQGHVGSGRFDGVDEDGDAAEVMVLAKPALEGSAMQMYKDIARTLPQRPNRPAQPPAGLGGLPPPGDSDDESEEEGDDPGDLFTKAYLEGSRPQGGDLFAQSYNEGDAVDGDLFAQSYQEVPTNSNQGSSETANPADASEAAHRSVEDEFLLLPDAQVEALPTFSGLKRPYSEDGKSDNPPGKQTKRRIPRNR